MNTLIPRYFRYVEKTSFQMFLYIQTPKQLKSHFMKQNRATLSKDNIP